MADKVATTCDRIIEYSFYALFFFVPLAFAGDTSELFEFNKMWLTFVIAIVIASAWGVKSISQREFRLQRTPLDLLILLFLLSQIVSTIFSLDSHVSLWGYYSRFNGGLLSIISYVFLYYAFVSNFTKELVKRSLLVSLASGLVVTFWGIPSHFGYDPSCLLLRGSLDVSCWTEAFQPKIRIFSTLGQPNWLAAYLSILMPIAIALGMKNSNIETRNSKQYQNTNDRNQKRFGILNFEHLNLFRISDFGFRIYLFLAVLFYIALLYTGSRSGFVGFLAGGLVFFLLNNQIQKRKLLKLVIFPLLVLSLLIGTPIDQQLKQFTAKFLPKSFSTINDKPQAISRVSGTALETGGTESGKIRLIVWQGALDIWKHNPLFGTGVETFGFAYYKYRPLEHNLTSEWDYLYNKAHNEYLNYLATTGIFGLGSYLFMIGFFFFVCHAEFISASQIVKNKILKQVQDDKNSALTLALLASYISILVSNFLGFSVVILNLYLFLIPAFVFVLAGMIDPKKVYVFSNTDNKSNITKTQWIYVAIIILTSLFLILTLFRFWQADKAYSRGVSLDRVGQYQHGYFDLATAVPLWPEPVFLDEFSYNNAVLAVVLASQKEVNEKEKGSDETTKMASYAATLAQEAIRISDTVVKEHPNNIVFWKTRVRLFYMLSQLDSAYLALALDAIKKASVLAPTDAKVSYSLGVLYGQNDDTKKAVETLEKAVKLKPDYRDAYYALALFYHNMAVDKSERLTNHALQEKAVNAMRYILDNISSQDAQAKKALESWDEL